MVPAGMEIDRMKPSFIARIHKELEGHRWFRSVDFVVTHTEDDDEDPPAWNLDIRYRVNDQYYLRAITRDGSYYKCMFSPGRTLMVESSTADGRVNLFAQISEWLDDLRGEVVAEPVRRAFEEKQRAVDALMAKLENIEDEYFTRAEAHDLRQALDDLERRFEAYAAVKEETDESVEEELRKIRLDFELFRNAAAGGTKRQFYRTFFIRVAEIVKDPERLVQFLEGSTATIASVKALAEDSTKLLP